MGCGKPAEPSLHVPAVPQLSPQPLLYVPPDLQGTVDELAGGGATLEAKVGAGVWVTREFEGVIEAATGASLEVALALPTSDLPTQVSRKVMASLYCASE